MMLAPLAASLIQMAISRAREFEADRGGAEISGDPQALASALQKIHRYAQGIPMRCRRAASRNRADDDHEPAVGRRPARSVLDPSVDRGAGRAAARHALTPAAAALRPQGPQAASRAADNGRVKPVQRPPHSPAAASMLVVATAMLLGGCEQLGIETAESAAAARAGRWRGRRRRLPPCRPGHRGLLPPVRQGGSIGGVRRLARHERLHARAQHRKRGAEDRRRSRAGDDDGRRRRGHGGLPRRTAGQEASPAPRAPLKHAGRIPAALRGIAGGLLRQFAAMQSSPHMPCATRSTATGSRDMSSISLGIARLGPGHRRGDGQERAVDAAGAADDLHGVRRQRATRRAAADRRRRAAVGDLGRRLLRQPALRDLQRAVASVLHAPAAAPAALLRLFRGRHELRDVHEALPASRATARGRSPISLGGGVDQLVRRGRCPSVAGIVLADVIPPQWGLGFAGVLALLGMTCSLLSDRATVCGGGRRRRGRGGGFRAAVQAQHRRRDRGGVCVGPDDATAAVTPAGASATCLARLAQREPGAAA